MARTNIDPRIAERLIDGRLAADDVPPDAQRVAQVLQAARVAATQSDLTALDTTVAAMAAAVGGDTAPAAPPAVSGSRTSSPFPKLLAGSVAGLTMLFGGLAAAGALPSAAQNPVADIVSHVGIDLPRDQSTKAGSETASAPATSATTSTVAGNEQEATTGTTALTSETTVAAPPCPTPPPDNHGDFVSGVAQSSTTSSTVGDVNHGAGVSAAARSDCGKPSPAADDHGAPATTSTTAPSSTTSTAPAGGTHGQDPGSANANGQRTGSGGSDQRHS